MHRITLLAVLASSAAFAGAITGTITDTGGTGLYAMEVRAWAQSGTKGWQQVATTTTDGAGNYVLGVNGGTYLVDSRMSINASGDYGDRWYDVAAPNGNGYIEAMADPITLADGDTVPAINIALETNGGFDGTVSNGSLYAGPMVRTELKSEPRTNHLDFSKPYPHLGEYNFRGLVPGDYRVIAWDLNGYYETYVNGGPFTVYSNFVGAGPSIYLTPMAADPYEPNDSPNQSGASIDGTVFRSSPPGTFSSSGALIGPRGSDIDMYCWDVKAHDRYFVTAQGTLTLEDGSTRPHPFVDPVVALFDVTGGGFTFLKVDDDSGPVSLAATLDTGAFAADARVCAVVTTYGDTTYNGINQASAGRYNATIVMGNRSPSLDATFKNMPVGQTITIDEGETLNVAVTFSDADGDPITAGWDFQDSQAMSVSGGSFNGASGSGTFTWTADQISARASPYTLHLHAADAEFTTNLVINVVVNAVNVPPTTPVLLTPADHTTVNQAAPAMTCAQSTDGDLDQLTYRFELYYEDAGMAAQAAWITPDGGAVDAGVLWQATTVPENTHVKWRARAFDGNAANGYSPWSGYFNYVVSTVNDPPGAPVIVKPAEGDVVIPKRPTIEVTNPVDPEAEAVSLFIQIASDAAFTQVVLSSGSQSTVGSSMTMWTTTQNLVQGQQYFVRAWGLDPEGVQSPYSNVVGFTIKADAPPTAVAPDAPFVAKCDDLHLDAPPPMISVTPSSDPDNDPIQIELSIFKATDDPMTAKPVFDVKKDQAASGSTSFDTSMVMFEAGVKYRVRVVATDGVVPAPAADCFLTVGLGTKTTQKSKGCGCGEVDGAFALLALLVIARRRSPSP